MPVRPDPSLKAPRPGLHHYLAQALFYGMFFLPLAWFSSHPSYAPDAVEDASLKLALRHAGAIIGECVPVSGGQYDKLPPNMRRPEVCPRERSPLSLILKIDGEVLMDETVPAAGLHNDGVSSLYRRFSIPAGDYQLIVAMNDDVSVQGATWTLERTVSLGAGRVTVIGFDEGFRLQ